MAEAGRRFSQRGGRRPRLWPAMHGCGVRARRHGAKAALFALVVGLGLAACSFVGQPPCSSASADRAATCSSEPRLEWPGPGNTGVPAGVTLQPMGGLTVTEKGAVVDGASISGSVTVEAADVVIRNSRISGTGTGNGVWVRSGSLTITDSQIADFENGLVGSDLTATRVEIVGMSGDGIKLGSHVLVADSWIHGFSPAEGAHVDGAQMQAGEHAVALEHNTIDMFNEATGSNGNSAVFLAPDLGPDSNGPVVIAQNLLDGGNFTVFIVDGDHGRYHVRNISLSGNRFGRHARYGPLQINVPAAVSGNVWADTGRPIGQ